MKTKILIRVLNSDKKTDAQTPSGLINYMNMNENHFLKSFLLQEVNFMLHFLFHEINLFYEY